MDMVDDSLGVLDEPQGVPHVRCGGVASEEMSAEYGAGAEAGSGVESVVALVERV